MKKKISMIITFIFLIISSARADELIYFKTILTRDKLEFEIKSRRNWLRLLNNKSQWTKYNLKMSNKELIKSKYILREDIREQKRARGIK